MKYNSTQPPLVVVFFYLLKYFIITNYTTDLTSSDPSLI